MEPILTINGLGFTGLEYTPGGWKPGDPIWKPGLNPPTSGGTTFTPTTPAVMPKKGQGMNTVNAIGNLLVNLGNTSANVIAALKGNQPVIVQNPQTGQTIDVRAELERQAQEQGKSNEQMIQMLQMMMMQNQNQPQKTPKDNTVLYVGIGVTTVALIGGIYYLANKKKK